MDWENAKKLLVDKKLIKVPEWTGFWYCTNEGDLKAFLAEGKIAMPFIGKYKDRLDWEETDGLRDIGGLVKALKSEGSIVNYAVRNKTEGKIKYSDCPYPAIIIEDNSGKISVWNPSNEEILAEDYLVWNDEMLQR